MFKVLVIAAIAVSLAGSLSAMSAQGFGQNDSQISRQSTTPSGAGTERPFL